MDNLVLFSMLGLFRFLIKRISNIFVWYVIVIYKLKKTIMLYFFLSIEKDNLLSINMI